MNEKRRILPRVFRSSTRSNHIVVNNFRKSSCVQIISVNLYDGVGEGQTIHHLLYPTYYILTNETGNFITNPLKIKT